ncbi:AmmeMemoRadiSam system protein B [Carboxylicivirga linearis]|uniref:AmmeMemoRadiSam system protein B n=1 Tax=Carboxylicivirga linearis TaxID=1628157 RepID=A0ABS5JT68_9BACT|nr:AmmeMemoRadiSam system protein B [Carboxylicivirga linearis]MBS2098057.1 AmmeMemoRadiSam system protein B [Carboxylicivirga linearis]
MERLDIRKASVAGMFYSANADELEKSIEALINQVPKKSVESNTIRALIVPHAGYVYSGQVAASAYAQLDQDAQYDRIVLIGSSHHNRFNGVSVNLQNFYETPLGKVKVDVELAKELIANSKYIVNIPEVHKQEHCLEVQLPFLQKYLNNDLTILPMVMGSDSVAEIKEITKAVKPLFTENNLFIISTDFSHYPDYNDAVKEDALTAEMISKNNPELLFEHLQRLKERNIPGLVTGLCGWSSVLLLQFIVEDKEGFEYVPLLYQNSGDKLSHNHQRVVGYQSFALVTKEDLEMNDEAREYLLEIARQSIYQYFDQDYSVPDYSHEGIEKYRGAFVSVYVKGKLRGCIGTFQPNRKLKELVRKLAVDAAMHDYRFKVITEKELNHLSLEISVLGPLKMINSIDAIQIGKHGIYLRKGFKTGTFLPLVAMRNGWDAKQFVLNCAMKKAGMSEQELKDAEVFIYDTIVFSDNHEKSM